MNKIKEKLLKGCGKYLGNAGSDDMKVEIQFYCGKDNYFGEKCKPNYCDVCKAKLQQHEETSKAKDEKFIKLLDKLIKKIENADKQIEFDEWETFMIFNIQEIKQRIKEE